MGVIAKVVYCESQSLGLSHAGKLEGRSIFPRARQSRNDLGIAAAATFWVTTSRMHLSRGKR
jgi:hypothetical protein